MGITKTIDGIDVAFTEATPVETSRYPGLKEETYVLRKGTVQADGRMPLMSDILVERDVPVRLRDGVTIRADIFRPVDAGNRPAIMSWAPYGKRAAKLDFDAFGHEQRMDVPRRWEDGLQAFEAALPSYWVSHGYVVIQPDPRGVFGSEGDIYAWGTADAKDCCDVIAWVAGQPWSNGKVGLSGNSWLAMTQYFVAAENPPHLAAIAPWEGISDVYRDSSARGGIPFGAFNEAITASLSGHNLIEDVATMLEKHPLFDAYWADKVARLEEIRVPAYIVASWTNLLHTEGTIRAWNRIGSTEKWLRVHNTNEWTDYLTPAHTDDLRAFFDHYLKGVDNDWPSTPKVRLAILDPGNRDVVDRTETAFPLARQEVRTLYLSAENGAGVLSAVAPKAAGDLSYDAATAEELVFGITFDRSTELTGYFNLKLFVEARGKDDMDIFAHIRKRDVNGDVQRTEVVTGRTHVGPNGRLRVSMRRTDPARSTELQPFMPFDTVEKLKPGEIVPVEIGFWPYGMRWSAGETLELVITGVDPVYRADFPAMPGAPTLNEGRHVLHFGGAYDAKLLVPFVPVA